MKPSRLSKRGQVTVPKEVREAIGLKPGDLVLYEIRDGFAALRRAEPFDQAFHAALPATFEEWISPDDEEAFRDL